MSASVKYIQKGLLQALLSRLAVVMGALMLSFGSVGAAQAAGTVQFLTPADGSSAPVGTSVTPTGIAQGTSTGGVGLDLALVIDTSGSMGGTRIAAAKAAANALIDALPADTTSVTIIEFDSSASVVRALTPLTPASNITALKAAVNGLGTGGGTLIGAGINAAATQLLGPNGTATRSSQMVVLSDGFSSGSPGAAAAAAVLAGVDAVHSVGLPGHSVTQMQAIATQGNGVYTSGSLDQLVGIFNGTGGNLVGVDRVVVTLPDGTVIDPNALSDGLGNFTVAQAYNLALGPNTWNVTAYFTDGSTRTDSVTVNGTSAAVIPLPAGLPLLLAGLGAFGVMRLRSRKA